jgi:hypothetical protein
MSRLRTTGATNVFILRIRFDVKQLCDGGSTMRIWSHLGVSLLALLSIVPLAAQNLTGAGAGKQSVETASFTLAKATQVPGMVLSPGVHSVKILDRLTDRMIVRIGRNGATEATFLGLPSSNSSDSKGPIMLVSSEGKSSLRGFTFDDGTAVEFVYPKGEAVDIAKANNVKIPAIDPASQGMSDNPALSKTDREMVTLWMLSPTPVGPNDQGPGVKAERYQEVASANTPPRPRPQQRAVVKTLPHTAGTIPIILLMAAFLLTGALALFSRRVFFVR